MKSISRLFSGLLVISGFIGVFSLLHAQETETPAAAALSLSATDVAGFSSLSDAELETLVNALAATPTLTVDMLPLNGRAGTFYSFQNPGWPPLPNDASGSEVWSLENGAFLLNDLNYDYNAPSALAKGGAMQAMAAPAPGVGGSVSSDLVSYPAQMFTTNDLWLQFVGQSNTVSALVIHTPWDTTGSNFTFDVFATTNLAANVPGLNMTNWLFVARSAPGQTNLTVSPLPGAPVCFYRLGTMQDSDGDGLTDAYEQLVSHTDPTKWDTDGDGVGDGDETGPSGLPWNLESVRRSFAVIYASTPTTTQGGGCAQCTVYLPSPAPAGGTTVQYRLGGTAVLNSDFSVTPTAGQLVIPAGASSGGITVCASSGSTYADLNLYADLTLTNATSCPVDGTPARVNIVDTGLPGVRVYALPPWVRRPNPTFGTNVAGFYFIRGGASTNALTVAISTAGSTATSGLDYAALPASITFAANVRTNWLPLTIMPNSTNPADKTLVLTMTGAPGYQIDAVNGAASVTIAATASPVLPVVQVTATDPDVTPASPGQFTFTRSFATGSALRVFYHVWGSTNTVVASTNGSDTSLYDGLPGYVDIAAGATSATAAVTTSHPLATVQPVTLVLAAGEYTIGASNMDTVYVDGAGTSSIGSPVMTRNGVYGPNENDPVEFTLTRYGSALAPLTMSWSVTNSYIGFKISSATISGDVDTAPAAGGAGSHVRWAARQSTAKIRLSVNYFWNASGSADYDGWFLPALTLSNSLAYYVPTAPYTPQWNMVKLSSLTAPATVIVNGNTVANALTITRPWTRSSSTAPQKSTAVGITLTGSAGYGVDYTMSTVINIATNQTSVTVPIQAFNATNLGWRTLVASVNSVYPGTQAAPAGNDVAYARLENPGNLVSDTDLDGDGLPDGYELNNGLDPTVPNNPYVDDDRDGLGLIEELELGSNPNVADAPPVYPSIEPSDYVPLTLRVGAVGKMLTHDESCAVCHQVTVRAGNFIHTSPRTDWTQNPAVADYLTQFLRGTNYLVRVSSNPYYSLLLPSSQTNTTYSPHYTAAYVAQFLQGTNGSYPFIVDPNHLIGSNLPMVQEVLPKTATLYIPDLTIAADNDRSGLIDFQNRNDRTEFTNRFTFWINDDCDSGSDDTAADLDPSASTNQINSANATINGLRDLEDFARLQFKIDALPLQFLTNGNYQVKVYLTNLAGNASLRLFPAVDGGLGYLTNTTTATAQTGKTMLGVVTNGTPLTIPATNWQAAGADGWFLPLIFEGISTGQCVLTFGFSTNNQPPVAVSRPFYLNLKRAADLYEHWTVGDNTNTDWTQIPGRAPRTADSAVLGAPTSTNDLDYIVFVHGWRMPPWERRAFASTAYKRLWQLGYKGRFGLYSWPTDYTGTGFWDMFDLINPMLAQLNRQNYDRSEQRAWNAAAGLRQLLTDLNETNHPYRVRLLAHSMGNIVASEALRQAGERSSVPLVQAYIASQAASVAHAYDATNPAVVRTSLRPEIYAAFPRNGTTNVFFAGMKRAVANNRIINFNNLEDYALNSPLAWPGNQLSKPDYGWDCLLSVKSTTYAYWDGTNRLSVDANKLKEVYDIYGHIAMAWSKALGCAEDGSHHIQGEIGGSINLNISPFNYKNNDYEHSAEFNSINMNRRTYWWQVLSTFSLTNNLPQL